MNIRIAKSAKKDMDKLDDKIYQRISKELKKMSSNPRSVDLKKYQKERNKWRLRVGNYRVILEFIEAENLMKVLKIRTRESIDY